MAMQQPTKTREGIYWHNLSVSVNGQTLVQPHSGQGFSVEMRAEKHCEREREGDRGDQDALVDVSCELTTWIDELETSRSGPGMSKMIWRPSRALHRRSGGLQSHLFQVCPLWAALGVDGPLWRWEVPVTSQLSSFGACQRTRVREAQR